MIVTSQYQNNAPKKYKIFRISMGSLRNQFIWIIILNYLFSLARGNSDWLFLAKIETIGPHVCDQLPMGSTQRSICTEYPKMIRSVSDGAVRGLLECQHQFQNDRWNCSTQSVFGKLLNRGTKEVAFINAITSAGVMHSVTKACRRGEYINCSCDNNFTTAQEKDANGTFTWGGCNDDSRFGNEFTEKFVDTSETSDQDPRSKMNLYNNMVGRKALKRSTRKRCKCHGPTASCELRTCWTELGDFRTTGDYLKERYNQAVKVEVRQDNGGMKPVKSKQKLSKNDLVYLDDSSTYCFANQEIGSLGTAGRTCNTSSNGDDNCDVMCCGRKYYKSDVIIKEKCNCTFQWCCKVECDTCYKSATVHACANHDDNVDKNKIFEIQKQRKRGKKKKVRVKGRKRRKNKHGKKKKSRHRRSGLHHQAIGNIHLENNNINVLSNIENKGAS